MSKDTKAIAKDALKELQTYLRRDAGAKDLLAAVAYYMTDLRRDKASLKLQNERLQHEAGVNKDVSLAVQQRNDALVQQLNEAAAANRQLTTNLAQRTQELTELRQGLEQLCEPEVPVGMEKLPPNMLNHLKRVSQLGKQVRIRLGTLPRVCQLNYQSEVAMLRLEDIVHDFREEEYARLGMFLAYLCLMGLPIGLFRGSMAELDGMSRRQRHELLHWCLHQMDPNVPLAIGEDQDEDKNKDTGKDATAAAMITATLCGMLNTKAAPGLNNLAVHDPLDPAELRKYLPTRQPKLSNPQAPSKEKP